MPPRLLRPKDDTSTTENTDNLDTRANKRRAVSSACIPCRKRKSKCDGGVPACSTCVAVYRTECVYDADSDHRRKGALKRDIQSLQQRNDALDVIVASLRALPEHEAISLLHSLRTDTNPDVIAASLRNNVDLPQNYAAQTLEADFAQQASQPSDESSAASEPLSTLSVTPHIKTNLRNAPCARTLHDTEFIDHLLQLYFSWIHPFHQFVSQEHFLHDFHNGRDDYCSAALANAVLAFACHYSDRQAARTNHYNPATAGDMFFAEAKQHLEQAEKPSLTLVQALGIMSLRETSMGRDSNGYQYAGRCVRMAIELSLHLPIPGNSQPIDEEQRKTTFWGAFILETLSSVALGRISQLPRSIVDVEKPQIIDHVEAQPWKAYEETISNNAAVIQPSQPTTFSHVLSQLCEMASDVANTFYAPKESFTSRKLAATYTQFQEWYGGLPSAFWLDNTALPHVIVLHMCYHVCILHLFRPYIKLDLRGANLYPRDACTNAANEISRLMNALRALYGLRRVSVAVISNLLSASTIHLLNLPQETAATNLTQAMHDLQTLSVNHPYAARCLDITRSLAVKWGISLPEEAIMNNFRFNSTLSSPSASIFYASSAPRQQSSSSRERSGGGSNESPFAPPDQQAMNDSFDAMTQAATSSTQMPFWSPYTGTPQGRDQHYDFQQSPYHGWQTYHPQQHQEESRRQSTGERQDEQQNAQQGMWQWDHH
ncbi:hypothetical protein AMS68_002980 [Peltaster fructicola]|uniref:Zn(2)-C6 fungal-type domain-containing protein n=1 Tax=Peltaster fructicola TaxID=286661 RepID=A0A6H0XRX7_9PEZI|nr:hypothetical protein AMS68_002980 [Peltaster fructicola]